MTTQRQAHKWILSWVRLSSYLKGVSFHNYHLLVLWPTHILFFICIILINLIASVSFGGCQSLELFRTISANVKQGYAKWLKL